MPSLPPSLPGSLLLTTVLHLIQLVRADAFRLFDYGSPAANLAHYGSPTPPDGGAGPAAALCRTRKNQTGRPTPLASPLKLTPSLAFPPPPPIEVASEYWRLDVPVHLVAGRRDGIIPPANIRRHLAAMRAQGAAVSYREFDFGHLDFTFGVKEDLRIYLLKLLRL